VGEERYGIEVADDEIAAYLTRQGHGVLSFGGEVPYGLPISFGYDVLENRCVFQLLFDVESRKREYVERADRATLVVYEWVDPDDWRSVVVDGRLRRIGPGSPAAVDASEVFAEYASVVALTVFDRPVTDPDPEWYELRGDELTGYQSPTVD
jgi:nitroimidazol reductase NimA-like FMN-containing flavoprotein (pyridoxamine 5'-phosphate oxidase superfamily)